MHADEPEGAKAVNKAAVAILLSRTKERLRYYCTVGEGLREPGKILRPRQSLS